MRTASLVLALLVVTAAPARAEPDGVIETGAGGAVGAIIGGIAAGGVVLVLADQGQSLSRDLGVDDSFQQLVVDFLALPAGGAIVGAGVGALTVSLWQGRPCSPATALAPLGAGLCGGACSLPGMLAAGVAFQGADQADNYSEACVAAVAGVAYGAIGVGSFCLGAPVGAALGGAGGAALVAPAEVPPPTPAQPTTPAPGAPTPDEAPRAVEDEAPPAAAPETPAPETPPGDPPPVLDPAPETTAPTAAPSASSD